MKFEGIDDDDIVISGIGCKFPETDNLPELIEKLYAGTNLVTKDARKLAQGLFDNVPEYSGKIHEIRKFDSTFFGISNIVVRCMDPMTRHILERTFEAVIDAGINPEEVKGTNAFVYSGTSYSDYDLVWQTDYKGGYGIMGRNRCMNANRVSYWLDLNGTSVALDSNHANGIVNLQNGWEALRKDRCDLALVSTANIQSCPEIAIQLSDLGVLSPDGKLKAFDNAANGYARADAVVVLALQKAKFAKRCYAIVEHVLAQCYGDRDEVMHRPTQQYWEMMLEEFYAQSKINVNDIVYVEGHGSGLKNDDTEELNAINSIFCKNRTSPLLIGSVKSNIGHTEASAAFSSVVKGVVCLDKGVIPHNLHYNSPNENSPGLCEGKIKVVDKNTPLPPNSLIAINNHGMGGYYGHVVLRANPKQKSNKFDGIPRLVLLADRSDDFMEDLIEKVESAPFDLEFINLLHGIHSRKMDRYLGRGYTILPKINDTPIHDHQVYSEEKRPIWFIFSGMGSQWPKMGKRLMDLPIFRESIERSHKILEKKGLNLIDIIMTDDSKIFENILHSFVGIAAVQIALVDVLNVLGIVPSGMIGHSVGELGCAYADGCFTAEQMILSAYSRGKASIETDLIKGFMAAIGRGYKQIKDELPEGIEVACRNAADSCTISGPTESVKEYVKELQERKIFARTVNVSNIAYHSQYIKPAAPRLLQYLKEVIPHPKLRSLKWISTSNLEENWHTDLAKYCSAEYHTNNLLSSVLFEEGCRHIPKNAICIEIAPHGLLQAILKRSLGEKVINVPLTNRTAEDPLNFLLQAIGKMFMAGLEPQVQNLYPKIEHPVSRNTLSLHQLVHWQHEQDIPLPSTGAEKTVKYSVKSHFLRTAYDGKGYLINESHYYPTSVFLHLVWAIFASFEKIKLDECPVIFENVRLEKPIVITDSDTDDVLIFISPGNGLFEISTDQLGLFVKGNISVMAKEQPLKEFNKNPRLSSVSSDEIYDEFQRRGYEIGNQFKPLNSIEMTEDVWQGKINSTAEWVPTLESIIQLQILYQGEKSRSTLYPSSIERLTIAPGLHEKYKESLGNSSPMEINYQMISNIARSGGIEMKGLQLHEIPKASSILKFESVQFMPFTNPPLRDFWRFVDYCFGILTDNRDPKNLEVLELDNGSRLPPIGSYLEEMFSSLSLKVETATIDVKFKRESKDFIICDALSLKEAIKLINERGFVLVRTLGNINVFVPDDVNVISRFSASKKEEFLFLKKKEILSEDFDFITIPSNESMLHNLLRTLAKTKRISYLIGYDDPEEGFENYKRRLIGETAARLRWILILDKRAPSFDPKHSFYANQLRKGLATNIYRDGVWGSFYQRTFSEKNFEVDSSLAKIDNQFAPAFVGIDFDADLVPSKQVEYSGKLRNGYQILGITSVEKNNKKIVPDSHLTWKMPPTWSLEDGATCTLSYTLAYYCIKIVGGIKSYETVMVTDGLTNIGKAAIDVALFLGARVYVTVGNEEEIITVRQLYPKLNEKDIFIHGDNHFDIELGVSTEGLFPEIIINTLEGERLFEVINCFARYGRIFHFGKEDLKKNADLGMNVFLMSTSFYAIAPEILCNLRKEEKEELRAFISKAIVDGLVKPLPRVVYTAKEIEKYKATNEIHQNRKKIILTGETFQMDNERIKIDSESSYILIGDDTDVWLDVAEWLIRRGASNIVISLRETLHSQKSQRRCQIIKNNPNVIIRNHTDVPDLILEANRLGDLAAVFVIAMDDTSNLTPITKLDKHYRIPHTHLVVISKKNEKISEICTARSKNGYLSTNFIWESHNMLISKNLNFLEKLVGKEPIIVISDKKVQLNLSQKASRMLVDILPSSIEDFCGFGLSLDEDVHLVELPTKGQTAAAVKELPPVIVIPGLQSDPKTALLPLSRQLMYPVVCVQLPHLQLSIQQTASFILPKILSLKRKGRAFNILGLSWGSYVAIEVARLIEELGGNVSLMLLDGPLQTVREAFLANKSLESSLINSIQGISRKIFQETPSQETLIGRLDHVISKLELPEDRENDFREAVVYIHHALNAILDYDHSNVRLKGPMTIIKSGEKFNDTITSKICNNVMVRNVGVSANEVFNSPEVFEIIHGSAITDSMGHNTIHLCSWRELEDFLAQEKLNEYNNQLLLQELEKNNENASPLHVKYSFSE